MHSNSRISKQESYQVFSLSQPGKWGFLHFHLRALSDSVFFYTLAEASQSS